MMQYLSSAKTKKKQALYSSPFCSIFPGLGIETSQGKSVLNGISLSYSLCRVHCLAAQPESPDTVLLDHTTGLHPGDEVLITNAMYGGGSRAAFQQVVKINAVNENTLTISPVLPPHIMRYTKGVFVLNRDQPRSVLAGDGRVVHESDCKAVLEFVFECQDFVCKMQLELSDQSPRVDVRVSVEYRRSCELFNLSLVFDSSIPLVEAYLKNRTIRDLSSMPLKRDLWLWKEGCRAAKKDAGWCVLHTPNVASCEIITRGHGYPLKTILSQKKPVFVVNLEHYNAQHFRLHREYLSLEFSTFDELSLPKFAAGDRRDYSFSMHIGEPATPLPRLMLVPDGFRALNVWTEHADKTTIQTHRASYFGHESITSAEDSTGGVVKHGHVVTKSVFCENPKSYQNRVLFNGSRVSAGPMLAMAESPDFVGLLDQLSALGHEICVHSVRPNPDDPEDQMEVARITGMIDGVYERYHSPTWIDHALESIKCCAGYQGLIPQSEWCMLEAWECNRVEYFWTWSSADFMPKGKDEINLLHNDGDGAMPTPLYWRHPILPEGSVIWGANECPLDYFSDEVVDQLIADRGVSIQQHYYPFLSCEAHSFGFIERDANGEYQSTQQFDHMLAHMSKRRDEGELMITTIGNILSYWIKLEGITHAQLPSGGFRLINTLDEPVPGLAFVVRAQEIQSDLQGLNQRPLDHGDILVWFDMPAQGAFDFRPVPHTRAV